MINKKLAEAFDRKDMEIEKWKSLVGELVEALDKAHDGMCRGDETCYVNKVLAKAREAGLK